MFELKTKHRIYGCHKLKNQGGKCTQWHGHQYEIVLSLRTKELDYKNMIIDTYDVEDIFYDFIKTDHLNLNEFMDCEDPTMEFMSKFFFDSMKSKLPQLYSVTVYETPESFVTYTED